MGPFVYHPAFRYSPEAAARQTADGQPARPEDAYALSDDPMLGGWSWSARTTTRRCPWRRCVPISTGPRPPVGCTRRLLPANDAVSTHAGA